MSPAFWIVVAIGVAFTLARFSEAFLVLKAQAEGLALALIPLVYVWMNLVYALVATPAGILSDRIGRVNVLLCGLGALVVADLTLALVPGLAGVIIGVGLWGLYLGFSQGLLSALVADTAPEDLRGTAFGLFNLVTRWRIACRKRSRGLAVVRLRTDGDVLRWCSLFGTCLSDHGIWHQGRTEACGLMARGFFAGTKWLRPPKSLEFAFSPCSQTGQSTARRQLPGKVPTRQILTDGPQVFRSLSVGARVQPGVMGAQSRGVFGRRGAGLDRHRPLRLPRNETGAGDVLRRAGLRRPFHSGGVRRLYRDLAEWLARHEPHPAGVFDRRGGPHLPRLSRPAISQAAADPRHHHRSDRSAALRGAGAAAHRRRRKHRRLCGAIFRRTTAAVLSRYRDRGTRRSRGTRF